MPLENQRANKNLIHFIGDYQPDEVINIGDITDYTAPSRWSMGTRAEFGMTAHEEAWYTRTKHIEPLRARYDRKVTLLESNHGLRPQKHLIERAPSLGGDEYREENLLRLADYNISFTNRYDFAPNWTAIHGHQKGISLSRIAGGTAMNAARKFQRNVVMGHTHRAGIISESAGPEASRTLTGVEVGHLMDLRKAAYLGDDRLANWQSAFGLFYVDGKNVVPHIVPVSRSGAFIVEGESYK